MRLWAVSQETGRELPEWSDDDVLDFIVNEALMLKAQHAQKKVQKDQEHQDFRGSHKGLTLDDLAKGGPVVDG